MSLMAPASSTPGGSAADDDEIERRVPALLQHLALGQFEGQQHAAANLGGVFDGFEAGRERLPLIVAEIGVRGAGGEHEVVVGEAGRRWPALPAVRQRRCRPPRP